MNGTAATESDLAFAPLYQEILELGTALRSAAPPAPRSRGLGCGRWRMALDAIEQPAGGGRCRPVGVLRQRYETSSADTVIANHELGYV